ncbi:T9SS type A sorting domain-containing protein [Wenyingzhuangia sp. 2_MG-2023]|uniref:T9SS type A sorting domain-containing protein n=1 Tax=Wenyingzhuangia sp. 2_MG-2023 TaxID=3062639 RepID=UPI0026E3E866|nr:T9SS type A sorting domain-containing protein [Wenyingzhuangia sp. 2_MG-2023]MDO6736532.1 T9SS type A sorting domain-containing protein [Wenyingzhuangia sp. 2_MG-2023]
MKKRLLYTLSFLIVVSVAFVVYDAKHVSKREFRELIENHPVQQRLKLSKKERKKRGIPPNRYFDLQYLLEMNPYTGKTYPENLEEIKNQKKTVARFSAVPGQDSENKWIERGPNNIGGRTRVVFYDPNDTSGKRVFAGGVSGGLWVNDDITNANSMWSQVGIDENLSVSCYAIDPNDSNTWYVGTGEAYTGNDGTGNGVWYTTNGGSTWSKLWTVDLDAEIEPDSTVPAEASRPYFFNQIVAWNNGGTTELFFSVDGGFDYDNVGYQLSGWWKLTGNRVERLSFNAPDSDASPSRDNTSPYVFSDVEIAADNSLWCATKINPYGNGGGKVFRTTDGENFTEKYSFSNGGRVELAVSKTDANIVYVLAEIVGNGVELVKTTDGTNFVSIGKPNDVDADISANDFARDQAFYNLTIEVDPTNNAVVYAGGIDLFRSNNGGTSWSQISKWSNNNDLADFDISLVHADHHAVAFSPLDANKGVFANDGGIYYCSNLSSAPTSTTAIVSRNNNYNITQFYSGAIGQDEDNEMFLGGAQDNGSLFVSSASSGINSFQDIYGGDGVQSFIDKDGAYLIVSYVYNTYGAYTLPLRNSSEVVEIAEDDESGSFDNIADLDDNLDILYTDGSTSSTPRISRFTNLTTSPTRRNFTNSELVDDPTAIRVSPYTTASSTIIVGTESGVLLKISNIDTGVPVWENIDVDEEINVGSISDIDFGVNENRILVTLHNYGINNIYYTVDGGITWQEKDGDFPDIPVKAIKMNPFDEDEVLIGTNLGVWRTSNFSSESPNWVQSQNGMSNVKVTKFDMRTSDNTLLASTYGRGLFTASFEDDGLETDLGDKSDLEKSIYLKTELIETGKLDVVVQNVAGEIDIVVYDATGKVISKDILDSEKGSLQELEAPSRSGLYIVRITNEGKSYTKKIIVVN